MALAAVCTSASAYAGKPSAAVFPATATMATPVYLSAAPIMGRSATSAWTEIVVSVYLRENDAFDGFIELSLGDAREVVHRAKILVPRGRRGRSTLTLPPVGSPHSGMGVVHLPVRADSTVRVRAVRSAGGPPSAETFVQVPRVASSILLSAGVDLPPPESWAGAAEGVFPQPEPAVVAALPRFAATYDNVVLFAMSTARLASIEPAACPPLVDWLKDGGSLVVVHTAGPNALGITAKLEPNTLPCGLADSPRETDAPAAGWPRVLVGRGRITFADEGLVASARSQSLAAVFADANAHHLTRYTFSDVRRLAFQDYSSWMAAAAGLLAIFAIGTGPLLFGVFRRRRRLERMLVVLPVFSVATFTAVYALGVAAKPDAQSTTMLVQDFASGRAEGRAVVARAFLSPKGPVHVKPLLEGSLLGGIDPSAEQWLAERGAFRLDERGDIVLNDVRQPVNDFVYFEESGRAKLAGPITIECTRSECNVTNDSGLVLEDAWLVHRNKGFSARRTIERSERFPLAELTYDPDHFPSEWSFQFEGTAPAVLVAKQRGGGGGGAELERRVRVVCTRGCEASL